MHHDTISCKKKAVQLKHNENIEKNRHHFTAFQGKSGRKLFI